MSLFARVSTALFYGASSVLIMVVNKDVLTAYRFPSANLMALSQMVMTLIILVVAKQVRLITYPDMEMRIFVQVFPLPLLFLGNLVTGLSSTKLLSLPMMTVLRRFSILGTMVLEYIVLRISPSRRVQFSVFVMLAGAIIAASCLEAFLLLLQVPFTAFMYFVTMRGRDDLAFDLYGYAMVTLNNLFTAGNGVYMKKKLDAKDLGTFGLMFYNTVATLPIMIALCIYEDKLNTVLDMEAWSSGIFQLQFALAACMGCVMTYSVFLCTQMNSALTTAVVGCLKNVLVAYIGIFTGGDYIFSMVNFMGLNISVLGSIIYSIVTFQTPAPKAKPQLPVSVLDPTPAPDQFSDTSAPI